MKFYQISILGHALGLGGGALFETRHGAEREVRFIIANDRRHAAEALREAGHIVECPAYEIHEVER